MKLKKIKGFIVKFYCWLILAIVVLVAIFGFSFYYLKTSPDFSWKTALKHYNPRSPRLLDGRMVDKNLASLKPIALMLENHFESRPVAGLEYASIIYETIIEGDITRFLAIFDYNINAKKIGPVRSARPFFVTLAEEWDAVYFHAGGSQEALDQLKKSKLWNINEISSDGIYFWRDKDRQAPHNLFTSSDLIRRSLDAKTINPKADFSPWLFKNDEAVQNDFDSVEEVEVNFSPAPLYQVKYIYNRADNNYTRYLAGKIHKTESGIILKAKNIVIQHVDYDVIDSYGRIKINLSGKGQAEIYQAGKKIDGYWEKNNDRTYFYENNGQPIKFDRGTIWIELLFN